MATLEDMCLAMDADPADLLAVGVTADLLDEMGDPRGPGMRVLWELGKTGRVPTVLPQVPNYGRPYYTKTDPYVGSLYQTWTSEVIGNSCRIDDEWADSTNSLFWEKAGWIWSISGEQAKVAAVEATMSAARLAAAKAWADATPTARQRWLCVMTGLAPDAATKEDSLLFLASLADGIGVSFTDLMAHAFEYQDSDGESYWHGGEEFEGIDLTDGFWSHYRVVTGAEVKLGGSFFSCAC